MLYERWLPIARARAHDWALHEMASGRRWTFAELLRQGESEGDPAAFAVRCGTWQQAGPDCQAGGSPARPAVAPCRAVGDSGEGVPMVYPQGHGAGFVIEVLRAWKRGAVVCPLEPGQRPPSVPLPPPVGAHLKFTSATTGRPRVVVFTGAQLAADADQIVTTMGLRPDWPNVAVISLAHSYGFSNLVLPLLLHGIPLIIAPAPLPETLRRAAEAADGITLPGVPALWRSWHEANAIPRNVRLALSAGAPLPAALEQSIHATSGLKVHNFYGSTECGGIAFDRTPVPRSDDSCVGTLVHRVRGSLNAEGCLCVRSPAVGETYWPEGDDALSGGVFQTGDLAEVSGDVVHLRGRLNDQINLAGRKVSPALIERALQEHPAVRECLVFGVPASMRTAAILPWRAWWPGWRSPGTNSGNF